MLAQLDRSVHILYYYQMPSPEIILLAGAPGSGKSSIADRFVELGLVEGSQHLDIGDLKRSIESGERPSAYAELLKQKEHPDRVTGAAPSAAMTGIMEEFILERPDGLTIVGGFPRYMDRVAPFKESMVHIGANVLALCVVELSDESILRERLSNRAERAGQKLKDPVARLRDHNENIVPTLEVLAQDYPRHSLDGTLSLDTNARALLDIYQLYSRQAGPTDAELKI